MSYGQEDRTIYDQVDRERNREWAEASYGWSPLDEIDGPTMADLDEEERMAALARDYDWGAAGTAATNPNISREQFG